MEKINKTYFNKKYDIIINKIKNYNLKKEDLKHFVLKHNISDLDNLFPIIINKINELNTGVICKNNKIKENINFLSNYLNKSISKYIISYICGYKQLTNIIEDDNIEEIMINDYDKTFILTRNSEKYITDIAFSVEEYNDFLSIIKKTINADFNKRFFIDGILPNNSRINIVSKNIGLFDIITIRKFTNKPLTILDLIKNNTLNISSAAYLWTVVDGFSIRPANIFICGGTSSGKTTFLNILLDFINPSSRIILIEDTREIDLSAFKDSISLTSDISNSNSLFEVTINTLRMRPDRIIVGEVRGQEVQGLFAAMDTGHQGCMATLHANNSNDVITKLISKPFEISEVNINLLDIVVILKRKVINEKIQRYISEISEIQRVGNININRIFDNENLVNSKVNFMSSSFLEKLCVLLNISKKDLQKIIYYRCAVLEKFLNKEHIDSVSFRELISSIPDYKQILKNIDK
jgi:archaeal flagellar protein FlaI